MGSEGARDVAEEVGPVGGVGNFDEFSGVVFKEGREAKPDELGEVVVGGVIPCDEVARKETSVDERQALSG